MTTHKSPLRYPGGKQKLAPFVAELMMLNGLNGGHYVEPYAGGAGVAVDLLLNGIASRIHLNDACPAVHAFWKSILKHTDEFCSRISAASLTVDEWRRQRAIFSFPHRHRQLDVGFSLFYLNRVNRSGIPTGGLIGGLKQNGEWNMDARFPRNELIRRIELIASKRSSISIKNWDAEAFIGDYVKKLPTKKTLVYCDPPYFRKADRLYLNHYKPSDHSRISRVIQKIKHPWLVSYDAAPEILECYPTKRSLLYALQYSAGRAYKGTEVLFFSKQLKLPKISSVESIARALQSA